MSSKINIENTKMPTLTNMQDSAACCLKAELQKTSTENLEASKSNINAKVREAVFEGTMTSKVEKTLQKMKPQDLNNCNLEANVAIDWVGEKIERDQECNEECNLCKVTGHSAKKVEKVERKNAYIRKVILIAVLAGLCFLSVLVCVSFGGIKYDIPTVWRALFTKTDTVARLVVFKFRLPRILTAGLVGICLSLSGCILQGVMRNNMASPSTIGVTAGASFVGYLTLVAFPAYAHLLPIGSMLGAFLTTLMIYFLAYQKGVSPVRIILSGLAVSALFGAFNDVIRTFFSENISNVTGFLVGGLNGVVWKNFLIVLPYALIGIFATIFLPAKMNILMLGDETANSLGLRVEHFRFLLIVISSLLAGSAIAVAGLISFVGLMVPHIARLLVGSNYKYLFPASTCLGFLLVVICDTIGRVIILPAEIPVSIILSFIGAPFFLYLLRSRGKKARG